MTDHTEKELHRAKIHLSRLEKDPTHPIDLIVDGTHTAPTLVVRAGENLRSAHSDAMISYEQFRDIMMAALQVRIAELEEKLVGSHPRLSLDELQYGDQTEA